MTKISVILPVHDRLELFRRCLGSWQRQTLRKQDFELIVVDDHTMEKPGVNALLPKRLPAWMRYERLETDLPMRSPNIAWLHGVSVSEGDILVLTAGDTIVPRDALKAILAMVTEHPDLRCAIRPAFMTEQMMYHIDAIGWETDWSAWDKIPGFWTEPTRYGRPNGKVDSGGMHLNCSGMTRDYWDWIGGLRHTPYFATNDRDLVEREQFLNRLALTVPDLFCVHQYHGDGGNLRATMAHPGWIYKTEAQARLREEAPARGEETPMESVKRAVQEAMAASAPPAPLIFANGTPPRHVMEIFDHILDLMQAAGARTYRYTHTAFWSEHFHDMATYRGLRVEEREPDIIVSLMEMQRHDRFEDAWDAINALRLEMRHLLVMVPYRGHFAGGPNKLQFDEASLQAPIADAKTLTGYLIGQWPGKAT